ncbi:MAG: endopeptidase [Rhodospirillales bacterium]|jgi:serine protease Do|nr:endopeptidase [Rhodospirillales bacterium]
MTDMPLRRGLIAGLAAAAVTPALPAFAQRGALLPDFADLAERVLPAVVNINVSGTARRTPQDRPRGSGGPQIRGAGSGFIIEASGFVVTNSHVVGTASRVVVGLQDGTELVARLVAMDELSDLALLKVESRRPLPVVPWGASSAMRVGNWVVAAGNPFALGGSITVGIISARGRDIGAGPFDDFLQTDAPINPGNSGGPLFNMAGEVIGINTAIYSPSGASAGIGFAVPSDAARPVVEQLVRGGRVERGWLGVAVQDASEAGRGSRGAIVMGVERNSPAARAGLRQGDVVTLLNGEPLETSRALVRGVALLPPGQTVRLTLTREGRPQEIAVQIGRRPPNNG